MRKGKIRQYQGGSKITFLLKQMENFLKQEYDYMSVFTNKTNKIRLQVFSQIRQTKYDYRCSTNKTNKIRLQVFSQIRQTKYDYRCFHK